MSPVGHAAPEPSPASLGELALVLWRARWRLAAFALGGVGAAAAWAALAAPGFRAEATILIEQQSSTSLLGDLAQLASMATLPATASELSVLESRTLAEQVLAEGRDASGAWDPDDERSLGLTTLVEDPDVRPLALLRRAVFEPPPPAEPLVLPPRGLRARVTAAEPDAPEEIALEFLGAGRVRLARAGLLQTLRLAARDVEEHAFTPRAPLAYQGLVLELGPWGAFEGERFVLQHLPPHEAMRRLQERLSVRETALNSGVIEVALEDTDPRRAARTVNALCRRYLDTLAVRGQRRASRTVEYVQGLLDEAFARFSENQAEMLRLQQASPEMIAPEEASGSLIEQLSTLEVQEVQIELSQRVLTEIVGALEGGDRRALAQLDSALDVGVIADPSTAWLLQEIARMDGQTSLLASDLSEEHPLLVRHRTATETLVTQTREQLASRLAGLRSRSAEVTKAKDELRARLAEMPEGIRELTRMHVELDIHKELVPYLIKSLQGAEITRSSAETLAELVDPAVAPDELAAPDLRELAALGRLGGHALGTLLVFVREPARGRVHTAHELARALGAEDVSVLARLGTHELAFQKARAGPAAETIRRLRGTLRFAPGGAARRCIGVAALGSESESAALAAELALAFAGEGRRTLLVEAGFARAVLGPCLGLASGPGLAQHLLSGAPWEELVQPSAAGPALLPAGTCDVPAGDLLAGARVEEFLREAGARYDVVVLAVPSTEVLLAAPALARALDVVCVVHRAHSLPRARVTASAAALRAAGALDLAGVLVGKRA